MKYLNLGLSLLSGALTLSIMILPLIMRTTEEALRSVPDSYREGSFGLGAGKLRTVFSIVLPCAVPVFYLVLFLGLGALLANQRHLFLLQGTVAKIADSFFLRREPCLFICILFRVRDCISIRLMRRQLYCWWLLF